MTSHRDELIKQAFAYGSSVALQEAGYGEYDAEEMGVKLAAGAAAQASLKEALKALFTDAGASMKGMGQKAWGGITGAGSAVGEAASGAGRRANQLRRALFSEGAGNVGATTGHAFPNPRTRVEDIQRMARMGTGLGLGAGAGLGVGGTLGAQELLD